MAYKKLKFWFDKDLAVLLAEKFEKVYGQFDSQGYIEKIGESVDNLELKARVKFRPTI